MNRNPLSLIFSLIVLAFLFSVNSVFSASSGISNHMVYLPIIQRPIPWQEVGTGSASGGGISNNVGSSLAQSLAIAPDGTPYVSWYDGTSGASQVYVRTWTGSSWEEVGVGSASGGGISNNGSSSFPSIAVAPNGTPFIAWQHGASGEDFEIYVRVWNGIDWVEVGTGSATGEGISNTADDSRYPSLAIAPDGTPYIAWAEGDDYASGEIYVRTWNGSSWQEVGAGSASEGGISNNEGDSNYPSLTIAPDGTPYVAWGDDSGIWGDEIYVRAWNGNSWAEVGIGSASGQGISNTLGNSGFSSIAIAPDGKPYVAWNYGNFNNGFEIYVRAWNGSSWEEVGAGSASGGGISDTARNSFQPSISISPTGIPYVAWFDETESLDDGEIYVRSWNGNNWAEVGLGSATGGGISNNPGASSRPSLILAPDGTPYVAWEDKSNGNLEIYIRRYIE